MAGQGWHGAFLRRGWRGGSTKQDPRAPAGATDLILAALEYGIFSRDVRDGQLIHLSDRVER